MREKTSEIKLRRQEQLAAQRKKLKQAYLRKKLEQLKSASVRSESEIKHTWCTCQLFSIISIGVDGVKLKFSSRKAWRIESRLNLCPLFTGVTALVFLWCKRTTSTRKQKKKGENKKKKQKKTPLLSLVNDVIWQFLYTWVIDIGLSKHCL